MLKNLPKELANYTFSFLSFHKYNTLSAYGFSLDYKQYFKNNPKEIPPMLMDQYSNNKEYLRYHYEKFGKDEDFMIRIGINCNLSTFKFLHDELKVPFAESTTIYACQYNTLDVIKFLHYHANAKFIDTCIDLAASYGHLTVVKFLYYEVHLQPSGGLIHAIQKGHLEMVKFLIDVAKVEFTNGHLELALAEYQYKIHDYLKQYVK